MIHKNRLNRRVMRKRKIKHKERILKAQNTLDMMRVYSQYPNRMLGQLAKGKVHCSCPMCSHKSKKIGNKRNRSEKTYTLMDRKNMNSMAEKLEEYKNDLGGLGI